MKTIFCDQIRIPFINYFYRTTIPKGLHEVTTKVVDILFQEDGDTQDMHEHDILLQPCVSNLVKIVTHLRQIQFLFDRF